MGRYKSLLTSQIDARRFEHGVDIPEAELSGKARPYTTLSAWCQTNCAPDQWACHNYATKAFERYARFYFLYPNVADDFAACFDGRRVDRIAGKWLD